MKSAYAIELQRKRLVRDADQVKQGYNFAMLLVSVALNNIDHFGAKRLDALEKECQRLMDEEVGPDPEFASSQLLRRIKQIREENHEKA